MPGGWGLPRFILPTPRTPLLSWGISTPHAMRIFPGVQALAAALFSVGQRYSPAPVITHSLSQHTTTPG
uniref:Uncharacterized protein n=1 Tax=Knipowitschia caucasica TaxID=637954 RepID=A0AAV2LBM6_KNICA